MDVDVVTVAYRSARHLRDCVAPLAGQAGISVHVVDNACPERSADGLADLPVDVVHMGRNAGFGAGCNAGAAAGRSTAILFLNPDARLSADAVRRLGAALDEHPGVGAVGPHLLEVTGETQPTMRRAPSLRTAFAEALFLHHVLPGSSEIVQGGYEAASAAEWLSGAALCVRREAFEAIGGFDERLFLYSEDTDLCVRLRAAGWTLRYEPAATGWHEGGASAPRPGQAALRAEARKVYARLHASGPRYAAFRVAIALYELARIPTALTRSRAHVRGRVEALQVALGATARPPA